MRTHRSLDPSIDKVKGAALETGSRRLKSVATSRRSKQQNSTAVHDATATTQTATEAAAGNAKAKRRHRKHKSSDFRSFFQLIKRRTWILPLLLTLPFLAIYAANPGVLNPAHPFIFPSYAITITNEPSLASSSIFGHALSGTEYGKGPRDILFVAFYTLVISFFREFVMHEILHPLGAFVCGLQGKRSRLARFKEQMYTAAYTLFSSVLGVWVLRRRQQATIISSGHEYLNGGVLSPGSVVEAIATTFSTISLYEGYPHRTHDALTKTYYLLQAAFWAQQALVMILGLERRRKDFKELVLHHVVTVALVALSWRFHFAVVGVLVFVTHDLSDFFLAVSKSINYTDHPAQAPSFALCITVWIYLRHYVNLNILYSVLTDFRTVGSYVLDWETELYKCEISNVITFVLLAALQGLNMFWLYCLMRSAWKFVVLGIAKDDREDGEDEDEEIQAREEQREIEVGVKGKEE
ncbi:TLC domain-containing protein [Xylariaceae sp. FL0255]|nr:TLC domain-containing protein [Xylariaceae sp. FL0255]